MAQNTKQNIAAIALFVTLIIIGIIAYNNPIGIHF